MIGSQFSGSAGIIAFYPSGAAGGAGDDVPLCESQIVRISLVRCNMARNGYVGAAYLDRLMSGGRPKRKPILIPPRGVALRQSTDMLAIPYGIVRRAYDIYAS